MRRHPESPRALGRFRGVILAIALGLAAGSAAGEDTAPAIPELEGIGIDEHRNAQLPLDLAFTDDEGRAVKLGDYFNKGRPVVLSLVYFQCPMLCGLVLKGEMDALHEIDLKPGKDYEMVVVSFDETEGANLARMKKRNIIKEYEWPEAAGALHLLTGDKPSIDRLTETVGFNYRWDPEGRQFAHASAIYIVTPDGRLARYLYGIQYPPRVVRLSLIEAGEGKIGSAFDQILLYCFHYDADSRNYAPMARNIMKLGGGFTVAVVAAAVGAMLLRERRSRAHKTAGVQPA